MAATFFLVRFSYSFPSIDELVLYSHDGGNTTSFNFGNASDGIPLPEQFQDSVVFFLLGFFRFTIANLATELSTVSFIHFPSAIQAELDILTFHLADGSKYCYEDCQEGMFFPRFVEYAEVLLLEIYVQLTFLAKHHVL